MREKKGSNLVFLDKRHVLLELPAANAIGRQLRDPINSGLALSMAYFGMDGCLSRGKRVEGQGCP